MQTGIPLALRPQAFGRWIWCASRRTVMRTSLSLGITRSSRRRSSALELDRGLQAGTKGLIGAPRCGRVERGPVASHKWRRRVLERRTVVGLLLRSQHRGARACWCTAGQASRMPERCWSPLKQYLALAHLRAPHFRWDAGAL
jgi:hypothetical protein